MEKTKTKELKCQCVATKVEYLEEAGGDDIIPQGFKICDSCANIPKSNR